MDDSRPHEGRFKLGELLVKAGLLDPRALDEALVEQRKTRERLGEILVERGLVSEVDIAANLALQLHIAFVDLVGLMPDTQLLQRFGEKICRRHLALPLRVEGRDVVVAMADPLNLEALDELKFAAGRPVKPVVSTASQLANAISAAFSVDGSRLEGAAEDLVRNGSPMVMQVEQPEFEDEGAPEDASSDSPFVKMVDLIISDAVGKRASDIHIEPQADRIRVRNRIDGMLREAVDLPRWAQPVILSRVKIIARMDIAERRLPQDGRVRVQAHGQTVDLRISTLPTQYGEKAVIRILPRQRESVRLDELGLASDHVDRLRKALARPSGLVLVTGPTGSGKSSTLYGGLMEISSDELNILSVEDPVEYDVPGINQVQIHDKAGLTFPFVLRAALRQDPNVIMVGEIRDRETAEIAVQASLTGHLVLSTLHTNDAPSSLTRLLDVGIAPYLIASSLSTVLAQRLVRLSCTGCQVPAEPPAELVRLLPDELRPTGGEYLAGAGCEACGGSGYRGRTAIAEMLTMNDALRVLVNRSAGADEYRAVARRSGMRTLLEDGMRKVDEGATTVDEVLRVCQLDELVDPEEASPTEMPVDDSDSAAEVEVEVEPCRACKEPLMPRWVACPWCGEGCLSSAAV